MIHPSHVSYKILGLVVCVTGLLKLVGVMMNIFVCLETLIKKSA